jgi:protein required for attachment to host cells
MLGGVRCGSMNLFRNSGDEAILKLTALPHHAVHSEAGTTGGHQSSRNPGLAEAAEDGFAAGIVQHLNEQILSGRIDKLVIVAAPRALGEMRKHYQKALVAKSQGEISKDLTGHSIADVESAVLAN